LWATLGLTADTAAQNRLTPIVDGLFSALRIADVVCLGEGHASRNDADLRLALLRDPRLPSTVDVIVAEFVADSRQALLDRFVLDGASLSRDELAPVWRDTRQDPWESPVYEEFLRAVRDVNLQIPRARRVRVIAGDSPSNSNRGGAIRTIVAQQVLDKKLKALAIYGSMHCVHVGMGFPGELSDKYPGRFWSAYSLFGEDEIRRARRQFALGESPAYVIIRGTNWQSLTTKGLFPFQTGLTLGDMLDAIVWYGTAPDSIVPAKPNP
jgi:uncharacterized iron-regulated protein